MNRVLLTLTLAVFFILPVQADTVCEDPAFMMKPEGDIFRLHHIFNAGEASRRLFTEVHYIVPTDPHLTVGMGHWIGGKLAKLFQKLRQDQDTWQELTNTWAIAMTPDMWLDFAKDTGEQGREADAISRGLDKLLCAKNASTACVNNELLPWSHTTKARFNSHHHWFHAGWRSVSVLRRVAEHQVRYWGESIIIAGQDEASKRSILTLGGIASVISAESSGLGATMFAPGVQVAMASFQGKKSSWSLATVPEAVRPLSGTVNEQALLEDWRSLAAWQYYTVKKGRVRSRMLEIWRAFYEPTWGPLPRNLTVAQLPTFPRHSGCYMARGEFDTLSAVQVPPTFNCAATLPRPAHAPCVSNP